MAGPEDVGAIGTCQNCSQHFTVPAPPEPAKPESAPPSLIAQATLTEAELETESATSLESVGRTLYWTFLRERSKWMALGALIAALSSGGVWVLNLPSHDSGKLREELATTLLTVGCAIGIGMIVYQTRRCFKGPPLSPKQPDAAVRQFLTNCIRRRFGAGAPGVDGYVCLLNSAKIDIGSIQQFKDYWKSMHRHLQKEACIRFGLAGGLYDHVLTEIGSIHVSHHGPKLATARTTLVMAVMNRPKTSLDDRQVGTVEHSVEYDLEQVGDRWYLKSGRWPDQS